MTVLDPAVVKRLTGGKVRFSAQRRALDKLGIRYTTASNGEPIVREEALDATGKPAQRRGHRWDRIASIRNLPR